MNKNFLYEKLWNSLNQITFEPNEFKDNINEIYLDSLDFGETLNFFTNNDQVRTVLLKLISLEERGYLKSVKISFDFLMKNFNQRFQQKVTHDFREFQNIAIREKCVYAVCPISGNLVKSNQSIVINRQVIFYRFTGAEVFYLVISNIGSGFTKDTIYFPNQNLVLRYEKHKYGFSQEHLIFLKTLTVNLYQDFSKYFYHQDNDKHLAVIIGYPNFAHQIWNELSGLERLNNKSLLSKIDQFFILRETLGDIGDIFSNISKEKINYINLESKFCDKISTHANSLNFLKNLIINSYFTINIGDKFIPNSLNKKLSKVALDYNTLEIKAKIEQATQDCFPLLWISLRNKDRLWMSLPEGIVAILNLLVQHYPKLGIVFDGYSLPIDYLQDHLEIQISSAEQEIIKEQKKLINQIILQLDPKINTYDIVGCSLLETNLWAQAIDLYLCHYGTLQHKVGWFASKPGVVHSNAKLASSEPAKFRTYGVSEFGISPKFINPAYIKDLPNRSSNVVDLRSDVSNYDIDWQIIYQELIELIRAIQQSKTVLGQFRAFFNYTKQYVTSKLSRSSELNKFLKY